MIRTAYDAVNAARSSEKISTRRLINGLFTNFFELHGDRHAADDAAIVAGIAELNGVPVTVIGIQKGSTMDEKMATHFGCPEPEGYRKALRLMKQAEKFHRPVITLVNTPGAFPDVHAEHHGQGESIAQCLLVGTQLRVPYLSLIVGEGGSGGALALACGDQTWMFEDSIYSVLSPEGYASILWKDAHRVEEAAEEMRLTPEDLLEDGIIDRIVPEVKDDKSMGQLRQQMISEIDTLRQTPIEELMAQRHERWRNF
ncbi:carboxyltransferase subunit alpha [Paucilactobacillus suebicus]|uniref:acetyl-CoA carboxytransferase n=1 Tax=Paucilactobacillus suebicus DSM 5007 = KCTC 3549 TaxID=1423807 RepID=A0A0R1VWR6_9LACO|nr:carboxyltransferase subunit alpha [Paucilactobacillus suebicus]KRM09922.1 acetyl-coenzyme A carboxylase carboxyl transferase subunit alpha [Paucilactobacillus suebicus DSM 5007 = KCTC 3549]